MTISVIGATKANLMEIITNPSHYVIKRDWTGDGFRMVPVGKADVKDLTAEDAIIVKITNE